MANNVSGSTESPDAAEDFLADDAEGEDFELEDDVAPRVVRKDPSVRRKIEDLLERRRLREELGLYDDAYWDDI